MGIQMDTTAEILSDARTRADLSLRAAAKIAGTSHATLLAYERGTKSPTTRTFFRLLDAYGFSLDMQLNKRIRHRNGVPRDEELIAALTLAAQFPARSSRRLEAPKLREHVCST